MVGWGGGNCFKGKITKFASICIGSPQPQRGAPVSRGRGHSLCQSFKLLGKGGERRGGGCGLQQHLQQLSRQSWSRMLNEKEKWGGGSKKVSVYAEGGSKKQPAAARPAADPTGVLAAPRCPSAGQTGRCPDVHLQLLPSDPAAAAA